jgi:hypothetical protein
MAWRAIAVDTFGSAGDMLLFSVGFDMAGGGEGNLILSNTGCPCPHGFHRTLKALPEEQSFHIGI